jgi:hypothetical protein
MTKFLEKLTSLLQEMGNTTDEVAARLKDSGCLGSRSELAAYYNPVVRYLYRSYDQGHLMLAPGGRAVQVHAKDGQLHQVPIPPAVWEFLREFQAGGHPDLELGKRKDR